MIVTGSLRAPRARFIGLVFAVALILAGCTAAEVSGSAGEAGPPAPEVQLAPETGQAPVPDDGFGVLLQAHPADTYTELSAEERALVAEAADPATPPARLAELARHENRFVRQAAAGNTSTPAEALTALAADGNLDVRLAVAENPSTPEDALQLLLHDLSTDIFGNYYVREAAARNLARRS